MNHRLVFLVALLAASPAEAGESAQRSDTPTDSVIYQGKDRSIAVGATAQLWAVPLLGDDAMAANADPADAVGFVAHKATLGLLAKIGNDMRFALEIDALDGGLDDLALSWQASRNIALTVGARDVPYGRSAMRSSAELPFLSHALGAGALSFGDRLGLTAEGNYYEGKHGWLMGVYNGTEGLGGNRNGGLVFGGRFEAAPLGRLAKRVPTALRIAVGAGGLLADGPSVDTLALSADLTLEKSGVRLFAEALQDTRTPDAQPVLAGTLAGEVERRSIVAELSGYVVCDCVELALRYERYDNNRAVDDFGDQQLITGGINYYFKGHGLKVQANYIYRDETGPIEIDNNALVIGVSGAM
jgi:hypothetical protein